MMSRIIFRLCWIAVLLAIALLSVTTALANTVFRSENFYDFDPYLLYTCDNGSELWEDFDITEEGDLYLDKDGIPIKLIAHLNGTGKLYLAGAPGKYVNESGNWNGKLTEYDTDNDVFLFQTYSGLWSKVVVPGYGNILHDTGRMIFKWDYETGYWGPTMIFAAGPKEYSNKEFEEVCDYLAP